jgi:hypothetical protein
MSFDYLISRFPSERPAIEALGNLLSGNLPIEVTFEHLAAKVKPTSVEALARILAELTQSGALRRVIRIESRDHGGIADFDDVQDVPSRIHDWRSDEDIDVTPDRLRVIYKVHAND